MSDQVNIALTARLRHGDILLAARRAGSATELARRLGVCKHSVYEWMSFRRYPQFTEDLNKLLIEHTYLGWDDIWPEELRRQIDARRGVKHDWARVEIIKTIDASSLSQLESLSAFQQLPDHTKLDTESLREGINKVLRSLNSRERQVIEWRFGLRGKKLTLEDTGKTLGICKERIRQIEARAIRKLQRPLQMHELCKHIDRDYA